jgi:hypothetical protein
MADPVTFASLTESLSQNAVVADGALSIATSAPFWTQRYYQAQKMLTHRFLVRAGLDAELHLAHKYRKRAVGANAANGLIRK